MKHTIRKFKRDKWGCLAEDVKNTKCELGTGKLDRGGAEIIEGDIVFYDGRTYPITFHDCEFFLHDITGDLPLSSFYPSELEIYGHIDEEDNQ